MNRSQEEIRNALQERLVELRRAVPGTEARKTLLDDIGFLTFAFRSSFTDPRGGPDWAGRSHTYRAAVAELWTHAGWGPRNSTQALVRYYVDKYVRAHLDAETMVRVGILPTSPAQRRSELTAERRRMLEAAQVQARSGITEVGSLAGALLILEGVRVEELTGLPGVDRGEAVKVLQRLAARVEELRTAVRKTIKSR